VVPESPAAQVVRMVPMTEVQTEPKLVTLTPRQFALTIVGLQLILLLAALDQTIITTAMPRIITELGGFTRYAWATTSYLLTSTIAVPIFGKLSDQFGRKPLLLCGVGLFVVASIFCGAAGWMDLGPLDGMNQLILARAVQGLGGGVMLGLIFIIIADILSPADRGRYQGHFAAVFAVASIFGPALGGWIADKLTWRWLFFINLPLGALAMLVLYLVFPAVKPAGTGDKIDWLGITVFSGTLLPLLLGLSWMAEYGWTGLPVVLCLLTAAVMGFTLVVVELRAPNPLMPLMLFTQPLLAISSFSLFVTGIGMFGSVLLIPLFLQSVIGVSAAVSGALLTPLILTVAVTSIISGLILSKTKRYKSLVLFALLLMTVGVFHLARIDASSPLTLIIAYMLVVGVGMGLLLPVYTIVIQNAVPHDRIGTVTGFSQFFRSIGGTIGVALFGSIMLSSYRHNLRTMLARKVSPETIALLHNPLDAAKLKMELDTLLAHSNASETSSSLLQHVQNALVTSIDGVFMLYAGLLAITLIVSLWLEERPLRSASDYGARSETL
jgi:EmrB/QacA subfamily drug resistance transporter